MVVGRHPAEENICSGKERLESCGRGDFYGLRLHAEERKTPTTVHKSAQRPCGTPHAVFAAGTEGNVRAGISPAMHRRRLARVKDTHTLQG